MTIQCPKCHFNNPEDTSYCGKCATSLKSSEEISISHTKTLIEPIEKFTTGATFARRYQIIEKLGKGGMGKVYRVIDKKLNEEVALKLIKSELASEKKTIERFSNEIKLARKIVHKNVGRMYDLNEENGTHYITMEYVPGEDLKSFIRRSGQLTLRKSISIAKQICEGLAEAHRLGVIHRDLKASNIMIDKNGNARIMDFGIARSLESEGITSKGVMIGTPEYMSPEQVEAKEVDERSDIYSLGVILYKMLTGRLPFEGDTPLSVAVKHKIETPENPKEFNPQISETLSHVILKCMEKDKDKRYQDAEELLSELTKLEEDIPSTETLAPEREPSIGIRGKRFPVLVVSAILVIALLVTVYFFSERILQTEKKGEKDKVVVPSEQTTQQTVVTPPQYGSVEISSTPEGAEVYVDDENQGLTPFKRELLPGTYKIKIRKAPEFDEITDVLYINTGERSFKNYTLVPVPKTPVRKTSPTRATGSKALASKAQLYTLKINTDPVSANVQIDDIYKGKTPITIDLSSNKCQLKIEKGEEWAIIDEELTLKPGLNPVYRNLQRIKYSLSIKTIPPEAKVLIGDNPISISPVTTLVSIGECPIKIEKENYQTIEESIMIDSDILKTYELEELIPGKLRIVVLPYADVIVDGRLIGEVPPIKILEINQGIHKIEFVSSKLDKNYSVEVEIKAGESKEIQMNMETGESKIVKINSIQKK